MGTRSPTHAFDPTPALEHSPGQFSPLNSSTMMITNEGGSDIASKNVRFSQHPFLPPAGRHSIATSNVPLLEPVSSASQIPKHTFPVHNAAPGVDITAYIAECNTLNTKLREVHESERRAWNIERTALKARITELEHILNKIRDPKRRSSNDSSVKYVHSFRSEFGRFSGTNGTTRGRISSEPIIQTSQPAWKGPENTPPVTRVFTYDEDIPHLPSISEDEPLPALTKEISPKTLEKIESLSIPISRIDNTLDGITLKSTAFTSSFNKATSPQFASPARSPSPNPKPKHPADGLLHIDSNRLISPLDEKLRLFAGHTPMAFDRTVSTSSASSERLTPRQEKPAAPVPTSRPPLRPAENSDSYFSFTAEGQHHVAEQAIPEEQEVGQEGIYETEEDPALAGPLMLDSGAKSEASNTFLGLVDAKLSEAAERRSRKDSLVSEGSQDHGTNSRSQESSQRNDDDAPKLRVKTSTNFGSAWGSDAPGRI